MAMKFVRASSQYAYFGLPAVPGLPLVLGYKLKLSSAIAEDYGLVGVNDHSNSGYSGQHTRAQNSNDAIFGNSAQQPTFDKSEKTGLVTSTWQTAIMVWASTTSRQIWLDDVAGNLNATSISVTTGVRLTLGAYYFNAAATGFLDGLIGEVFQLNAVPSSAERTAFHNGSKPNAIWTSSLVRYWPLTSDAVDLVNGNTLTLVNSPTIDADHPTMIGGAPVVIRRRREGA